MIYLSYIGGIFCGLVTNDSIDCGYNSFDTDTDCCDCTWAWRRLSSSCPCDDDECRMYYGPKCHTNDCPVGVATTVPDKEKGLVVESPTQITAKHLLYRTENGEIITGEQYVNRMYKPLKEAV